MNHSGWKPIDYEKVNQLRNNNKKNDPHIQSYSMISPSDVPSHFQIENGETYLIINFKYLYDNEKKTKESIINNSIDICIGKNSKKIFEVKIHKDNFKKALKMIESIEPHLKKHAEYKVKKNSYSAICAIYKEYIKDFLSNGHKLAF